MINSLKINTENILKKIEDGILRETPFLSAGKLIRSKITLLLLCTYNTDITADYITVLTAGELIHCASLLHDDVIDEEDERRNTNSVRKVYDNKTSILYGNKTLTKAFDMLLKTDSVNTINIFNKTISKMCDGELLQIKQKNSVPTMDEYIEKSYLKTGSLFEGIILSISELSNGYLPQELSDFGKYFGTAFQIKNDLDNILSSKTDIENGIYTAPVIFSNGLNINEDSIEKTHCLIDNYTRKAINLISNTEDSEYKESLIEVIKCLNK